MKIRKFLLLFLLATIAQTMDAQSWRLTIKKSDGSTVEMLTSEINNISFFEEETSEAIPDKNVDQLLIKEIYNGGCMLNDGSGSFQFDKCIILYNNCPQQIVVNNLCFGVVPPYNSFGNNKNYGEDGKLVYESQNFIPIIHSLWYYPRSMVVEPFSKVVINICGAIDNTQTVSQSINYANKDYYCMYDPEAGYTHTSYYPAPADVIPSSHYLKGIMLGQGNGWTFSTSSPALIVFQTKDVTPQTFGNDPANYWFDSGNTGNNIYRCLKIPNDWILDGIEVYGAAKREEAVKRLTPAIDGGYVWLTNQLGHSLYRNVDKESTEARAENAGKLVYNYALGVDGSTDPSGIDAEASIRNGAHIYYVDTNNSTNDFHERQRCSLRD